MIRWPIFSRSGVTRGTSSLGAPSMNVRVAFWAPFVPPETGASRRWADRWVAETTFSARERE